jgi:peptidoglycan/LPS O-acetylase OafA/YrhL
LLAFFLSLTIWRRLGSRIQNWLLAFVQIAGGIAALSLVMSAIYTEDQFTLHQFWSRLIYAGFAVALFVAPFAFRRRGYRSIALVAIAVIGYCSILASLIFSGAHWLEWPSVGLILVFVCLLGWMSVSRSSAGLPEGETRRPQVLRPSP